jgi:uncharacterized SAM-binding protein YcdF (DUF218 family)
MTYYQPALLVFFLLTAYGLLRRRRLAWLGLGLLFLWSWPPFAAVMAGSLEWFYTPGTMPPADAQAIVVLSGGVVPPDASIPEAYPGWDTYQRCRHAAWLYRHWRAVPVIVSGGIGPHSVNVARLMKAELEGESIPESAILTEERSTSTYENGVFTAEILHARSFHKIVLVTEAYHMLRAEKVFRKLGFDVVPAPCAAYTLGWRFAPEGFLPAATPIAENNNVLHEWIGLAWYALRGRI